MKLQNVKIKFLEIDLKGCVYLNHFSHSVRIATFFKMISRLGKWCILVFHADIAVWMMQGSDLTPCRYRLSDVGMHGWND